MAFRKICSADMEVTRQTFARDAVFLMFFLTASLATFPQTPLSTAATEPYRFLAVHGHRSAVFGYAGRSLEFWGYPFQIVDGYTVDLQPQGSPRILKGSDLLTNVEVFPDATVRVWTGAGFQVKETSFVPLDQAAAFLRYDVAGGAAVDLVIHFRAVMDLMWPASVGGQEIQWDDAVHGYVLSESTNHYSAVVASPEIQDHEPIVNSTHREDLTQAFTLRPERQPDGTAQAKIYVALVPPGGDAHTILRRLMQNEARLRLESSAQLHEWKANTLVITTQDPEVNRALDWADTDLDQAWACEDKIGCGAVAGFGPSRPTRRPQYDWFFAGDGMIAAEAMLASGHAQRAREELEFILRYQNPANGMIWHEMSQSAGFLDWAGKYPYLYPHVDLSFQFLSTLADYYADTGDLSLITNHWPAVSAAFHFCGSLIDPTTGLPVIPANRMGANEQDRMREDAGLSAAWISASNGYSRLAQAAGHVQEAEAAEVMSGKARAAYASRYWSDADQFWISGYTVSNRAMNVRRSGPASAIEQHLFSPVQEAQLLHALASAAFQTDWGTRSLASDSPQYDPDSYSKGSVSALHTADTAQAFWSAHRPISAWQIWSGLAAWSRLDSLGHMEEVLTGNVFAPEVESVPEQTWSSAGFLTAAVQGLLGIVVDAPAHHLTLAPHRFPDGGPISIANLHAAGAVVAMTMNFHEQEIEITVKNDGEPIRLTLAPEIPIGASLVRALTPGKSVPVAVNSWDQEHQARIDLDLPHGVTRCRIQYVGGVWIGLPRADPVAGAGSSTPRIREVRLQGEELAIETDALSGAESSLVLDTPWAITAVDGGSATPMSRSRTEIHFTPPAALDEVPRYISTTIKIRLKDVR